MDELVSLFDNINVNKDWENFRTIHNGIVNNNNFQSLYYFLNEIQKYYKFLLSNFEHDLSIYPEKDRDEWNNVFSGMKTFVELYDKKDYSGMILKGLVNLRILEVLYIEIFQIL